MIQVKLVCGAGDKYEEKINACLSLLSEYEIKDIKHTQTDYEGDSYFSCLIIYEKPEQQKNLPVGRWAE